MGEQAGARPRVVVVGAGFAGLSVVRELEGAPADVTLVDRHAYSTFQPLLYQVATGGLNPGDITYPVRAFARRRAGRFRRGTVVSVDAEARRVVFDDGGFLDYDVLVLATGVSANYFGIPGAAEHSLAIYTRREALAVRDHLMVALEDRAAQGRRDDLAVVIVGGGATGVEMAGTLAELRNAGLAAAFPELDPAQVHVVLVEQGPDLVAPFHPRLRAYTRRELVKRGVDVRLNTTIAEVCPSRVVLGGGETLGSDVTIWAAGVAAADIVSGWGLPQGRGGRIVTGADLRVEGHEQIFAAGDLGLIRDAPLPQLAQPALQTGAHVGRQIRRLLAGEPTEPFRYRDKGIMATIGRRAAIVELPHGVRLTGTLAWLAWLALHIVELLGHRNRISTLINLSWRYLAWPGGSGVIVGDTPD